MHLTILRSISLRHVKTIKYSIFATLFVATVFPFQSATALPIDWHGALGFDSTLIDSFQKLDLSSSNNPTSSDSGSQEVDLASGGHANASFQSYLIKLEPVIIVNDSATIKGEISTGYGRGGRMGDSSGDILNNGFANSFYYYNNNDSTSSKNNLNFKICT